MINLSNWKPRPQAYMRMREFSRQGINAEGGTVAMLSLTLTKIQEGDSDAWVISVNRTWLLGVYASRVAAILAVGADSDELVDLWQAQLEKGNEPLSEDDIRLLKRRTMESFYVREKLTNVELAALTV